MATPDNQAYDYVSFSVTNGSDYDVKVQQANLFKNVAKAGYVRITATTTSFSIKLNSTSNPAITMTTSEILQF
jgi:uncharacterized protein (DUF2235 family)